MISALWFLALNHWAVPAYSTKKYELAIIYVAQKFVPSGIP